MRSAKAVALLQEQGIEAKNLKGGILAWIDKVDPTLAKVLTRPGSPDLEPSHHSPRR